MQATLETIIKKIIKYVGICVMTGVVLFAVAISLARIFMPSLEQYEQQITDLVAKELQMNVQFGGFTGDWYRFGPALKITDVVLSTHEHETVTSIDALYISINLFSSIAKRQLVPAYLNVIGLNVDVEQTSEHDFTIPQLPKNISTSASSDQSAMIDALKKYSRITVRRSQVNFINLQGEKTPVYVRRMVLSRMGQSHQLDVMLNLLDKPTRLDMMLQIKGDLAKPKEWLAHGFMELNNLDINDYLKPYAVKGFEVQNGSTDLKAWVDWRGNQLERLQAEIELQQLSIYSQDKKATLTPLNMQSAFLWERENENDWTLMADYVHFGLDEADPLPLVEKMKFTQKTDVRDLIAKKVHLDALSQALIWSGELPEEKQTMVKDLAAKGDVDDLKINWQGNDWQMGFRFNALSFNNWDYIPGVENLAGEIIANPTSGKLTLSSAQSFVDYTRLFPYELFFSRMSGDVLWQKEQNRWQVSSQKFSLVNEELTFLADFLLKGGQGVDTHLESSIQIPILDSNNLYHYLPMGEFSTDLATWLKDSIGQGQLKDIALENQGLVKDFPFYDENNGLFRLKMNMQDVELMFSPDWPKLAHMDGTLLFEGRQIDIVLDKANIFQTDLLGVSAHISLPKEGTSWVNVHGEAVMLAQQAVDFIQASPLSQSIGKSLDAFTFNLPATLTLDLAVPLDSESDETKINGVVQLSEGDVILNEKQLKFSDVSGVFNFTEHNVSSDGIHATLLGKPATLTMTPQVKDGHYLTLWQLKSTAKTADIAHYYPNELWKYIDGESAFNANFLIDYDAKEPGFDVTIASDLKGTDVLLPAPLAKTKDTTAPLSYTFSVGKANPLMRLQYANVLDAVAKVTEQNQKTVLQGARIHLGGTLTNLETPQGIIVTGSLPVFSVDVWDDFISQSPAANTNVAQENNLQKTILKQIKQVDVLVNQLEVLHYPLTKAKINLTQSQNKWLVNLNSNEWGGNITIPQKEIPGPIALNFNYCRWDNTHKAQSKHELDPRNLPALHFSCKDFSYNNKKLGTVTLELEPESAGVKFHNLTMTRANDSIKASGRWWLEQGTQKTRFTGHLQSNALDKTLDLVDIKSTILGSKANSDFSLSWPGNPFDFALVHLNGELNINLTKGVLVDVNPGFGRILSLLSIQTLQRRLRLDFSDVFKKGFSFDQITALVTINDGVAHSDNLVMKAPAAEMTMRGDVNLGTKQLNLTANLTTHISSSLPIAATIASGGNPIVGAVGVGVWAVDKIVKSQAGDMLGTTYKVTGTWEKPVINGK